MHTYFNLIRFILLLFGIFLSPQGLTKTADLSAILYDYNTGQVIYEKNADQGHYPASLTKMMTLYLTFQALSKEQIGLYSQFPVSYTASMQEPSKLGLSTGQYVTVHDLIFGVAVNSANDAATVLAEGLAGNVSHFSQMMNQETENLGMLNSYFENPNGLPNPNQTTTARDMLKLAIALYRDFPQYYTIFKTHVFSYHGRQYKNHNHLLSTCSGVDGIKTGYIRAAGYNLVGSANRGGRRLIAVVLGGKTATLRDKFMCRLFEQGFTNEMNFDETVEPLRALPVAPAHVEYTSAKRHVLHHRTKHVSVRQAHAKKKLKGSRVHKRHHK